MTKAALYLGVLTAAGTVGTQTAIVSMAHGSTMEPVVTALHDTGYPAASETCGLSIQNMSGASCVVRVERALAALPGVVTASVNLAQEGATVQALGVCATRIAQAAGAAGYPARLIADRSETDGHRDRKAAEAAHLRTMTELAAALTLPAFLPEMVSHLIPALRVWIINTLALGVIRGIQFVLTTLVRAVPGLQFYLKGGSALFKDPPDMTSLVALGTSAAWGGHSRALPPRAVARGHPRGLFRGGGLGIVTLILLSRFIEVRATMPRSRAATSKR